jgi:hypothetical protein
MNDNELEKICKEVVVAYFRTLPQHFRGWTEEDSGTPVSVFGAISEIRTGHLWNGSQDRYRCTDPLVSVTGVNVESST